ncbi:MAG: YciI family protein [Solirubrobacteraceae bacterium]
MADDDRTYMLLYDYVEDMLERRTPHRDAHLAHVKTQRDAGHIVLAGPLGDPPTGAALAFRGIGPDSIEEFVNDDPYVKAGLVTDWRVQFWAAR